MLRNTMESDRAASAQAIRAQVSKYHRTIETYVNGVADAGLRLARLEEPEGEGALLAAHPEWRDERRRPPFLLMAADRLE
jgi:hypothetical protein